MDILMRAAKTPASILIFGEKAETGKKASPREPSMKKVISRTSLLSPSVVRAFPRNFWKVNFFGHVKRFVSPAHSKIIGAKSRLPRGGTLFSRRDRRFCHWKSNQKLLRLFAKEREYETAFGENVTRTANLRVIAATKSRSEKSAWPMVCSVKICISASTSSPLRCRRLRLRDADLIRFAEHYEKVFCGTMLAQTREKGLSPEGPSRASRAYSWPGNLRELRNAIERGP